MKRFIAVVLVLTMIFSLGITAAAAEQRIEPKELYYRGISIYVNGTELIPQDVNGNSTEPFIIEGTTYLPVRALAGALGLSVGWDGATNTITLTSGAEVNMGSGEAAKTKEIVNADVYYKGVKIYLDGAELIPTDVTGKYVEPFLMGGSTYLPLRAIATALGLEVGWNEKTNTITLDEPVVEEPTEMVWRLVKQTVTNYHEIFPDLGIPGQPKPDPLAVNSVTEYLYNEKGQFTGMFTTLFDFRILDINCTYTYDNKLETISMLSSSEELVLTFEYQEFLRDLTGIKATINGEFFAASKLIFNEDGSINSELSLDAEGNTTAIIFFTYDDNGNCVKITTHPLGEDNPTEIVEREYDHDGRLLREIVTDRGNMVSSTTCRYDQNGNMVSYVHVNKDIEISLTASYDELGREISSHSTINGIKSSSKTVWSEDGLSSTVTTITEDETTVEVFTYAEDGRILRSELTADGRSSVTVYEYELLPVCESDELLDSMLALMGSSR